MDSVRWQRVRSLFDSAADQRPSARAAFLATECGDDSALRDEVTSLLAAIGDEDAAFERGAAQLLVDAGTGAGRMVGPYRLITRIGHGGMGAVYEAVRADQTFEKRVAIKFIRPGFASAAIVDRFRRERQILATFEHPNVARLLDAGAADDGQPYLVMEFVQGEPIDQYCDERKLGVRDRLGLFLQVCAAVQYAHGNLVLHRDLKPSNILVGPNGTVKLLDFGIAKLIRNDEADEPDPTATLTEAGVRPLTPEYASPEQLRDEPLSVASDVYALGIVLYELLAGRRPFVTESRSPFAALEERDKVASRPSAVVTDDTALLAGDDSSSHFRKRLTGELDNIVLKALRPEPARRYSSVAYLAEDIRRYLDGRPVSAQPDSAGYRARKFVGRHRGGVSAGVLGLLALVVGATAALVQAQRAAHERDAAQVARATAERTSSFLQHILSAPDGHWYRRGRANVRFEDVLDDAVANADTAFRNQPAAEALVRRTIGRTYGALGRYADAERQLGIALAIDRRINAPRVPDQAQDLHDLGGIHYLRGDWKRAEPLFRASLALCKGAAADTTRICYTDANDIGVAISAQGFAAASVPYFREAVRRSTLALGQNAPGTDVPLGNLGAAYSVQGDFRSGEGWYRKALEVESAEMARGHEPINRALTLNNLAGLLLLEQRFAEAEALLEEALRSTARTGDADTDIPVVALTWANVAELNQRTGHLARADSAIANALRARIPAGHPAIAGVEVAQGRLLIAEHRPVEGERVLRDALAIQQRSMRAGDPRIGYTESVLGTALAAQGRSADARVLLSSGVGVLRREYGDAHPRTIEAMTALERLGPRS
ncbi:MAG: serine/threonine-protein kinase [Gemmatimonadota bacterium]|nr:serine/threonine-protein kinase [Gemmatimonadota bacterium]